MTTEQEPASPARNEQRKRLGYLLAVAAALRLAALAAGASAQGPPPPLLPELVVRALAEELSGTAARHTIQELTLYHRQRASEGFARAAERVRQRAEGYGLAGVEVVRLPADGETFYGTQRSRPAWNVVQAELWEQAEVGGSWADAYKIADGSSRPISVAEDSASGNVSADLVDVGAGTVPGDYAGREVQGRIVLTTSQPGAVEPLAIERGAVGIVSAAQNQHSAWWGEDRNLVRWGHMETFPEPAAFAFMVTVNQSLEWKARLERGERVHLRASIETRREPGSYLIVTAIIPGADPVLRQEEVVFSCHLDHQRPGANDNASGCAAILEVARTLQKLVAAGRIPPPRRTLRFVWPPEVEGTIALLNARTDLAARARAVIHMDMVGGREERTRSILHVTRSPRSLPTAVNDVAEAFGRFVNEQSYAYAATGEAEYPLVDSEGSRQALRARIADFSMGSDHEVWTEGSFRVPAIYLNDWPDRYIHTHEDGVQNIDPTKLLRAAFIGAASGYYLATVGEEQVPELLGVVRRHALERSASALGRAAELPEAEASRLLWQQAAYERGVLASIGSIVPASAASREAVAAQGAEIAALLGQAAEDSADGSAGSGREICRRNPEPKGPLWGFGYSWFEAHLGRTELDPPELLSYRGRWGSGSEYAYEVLNLIDGERSLTEIRDAASAAYGPIPLAVVRGYIEALEAIAVVDCE
jgi:aminopeptidase YwaD